MKAVVIAILVLVSAVAQAEKIALVQYNADLHFGSYSRNVKALVGFADQAVQNGAKIIVFPEGSHYGYVGQQQYWCHPTMMKAGCHDVREVAEPIPAGATSAAWQQYARVNNVYVLFNLPEIDGINFYNTTAVVGPKGFVTKYRKRLLYVYDTFYARDGDLGPVAFDTPYGKFGLLICADANRESFFREYQNLGVMNVIVPMDWDQDPNGKNGGRPGRLFFQAVAQATGSNIFVSDVSAWDSTGVYLPNLSERVRDGLAPVAVGVDGISYFELSAK